jgi:N-acetylmuramoyl-L-alanine amidase
MIYQGSGKYLVNEVVLHCAAINTNQFHNMNGAQIKAEIRRWHLARGFKDFGYHGMFLTDGTFVEGRPYTTQGAHVVERNRGSIGFLMIERVKITKIGKFDDWFTEAQRKAVRTKIKEIPGIKWVTGHNDYANKLCPGFKVKDEDWL